MVVRHLVRDGLPKIIQAALQGKRRVYEATRGTNSRTRTRGLENFVTVTLGDRRVTSLCAAKGTVDFCQLHAWIFYINFPVVYWVRYLVLVVATVAQSSSLDYSSPSLQK